MCLGYLIMWAQSQLRELIYRLGMQRLSKFINQQEMFTL
jgi:hypothetical protein